MSSHNSSGVIERIPILRWFHCSHDYIEIVGFREAGKADYRCQDCDKQLEPWKMDKNYSWVDSDTCRSEVDE